MLLLYFKDPEELVFSLCLCSHVLIIIFYEDIYMWSVICVCVIRHHHMRVDRRGGWRTNEGQFWNRKRVACVLYYCWNNCWIGDTLFCTFRARRHAAYSFHTIHVYEVILQVFSHMPENMAAHTFVLIRSYYNIIQPATLRLDEYGVEKREKV